MRASKVAVIVMLTILAGIVLVNAQSATGYYLPKGYKVRARIYVPGSPFWPGELAGDTVGISCERYSVLVKGFGYKQWWGEANSGIRVYWVEGGVTKEVASKWNIPEGDHEVEIVYGHDGYVYISIEGTHVYGFAGTVEKYSIVSEGAEVSPPEALPTPKQSEQVGSGYAPKSAEELRNQYLLLGLGAGAISVLLILMIRRRR